jgi:hypothetical protein
MHMTHEDLASLSAAHHRCPKNKEILGLYNLAQCRIHGHLHAHWLSVGKVTEDGQLGSYCGYRGCEVCPRCDQVTCEHAHLYDKRPPGTSTLYEHPDGLGCEHPKDDFGDLSDDYGDPCEICLIRTGEWRAG